MGLIYVIISVMHLSTSEMPTLLIFKKVRGKYHEVNRHYAQGVKNKVSMFVARVRCCFLCCMNYECYFISTSFSTSVRSGSVTRMMYLPRSRLSALISG